MKLFYKLKKTIDKITYKESYDSTLKEITRLNSEKVKVEISLENAKKENEILKEEVETASNRNDELSKLLLQYEDNNKILENKIKLVNGSLGGKTKQINKLTKEIEELETKLKESMTDKYLVKKIPSGKTPNLQKTKVNNKVKPVVQKYMKEIEKEKVGI